MISCYKCEKCGRVFMDSDEAYEHESRHFSQKNWINDEDEKVIARNTEYEPELWAPSAVVVPMERTVYENGEFHHEISYVKYYYSAKKPAEQVFPIDESKLD